MNRADEFVIITGGPGSGKSTLIGALRRSGYACVDEAGRAVTRAQTAIGGRALHGGDQALYAEVILAWEMRSYGEARERPGTVFFDRGIPDLVGYHLLRGLPVPAHFSAAVELCRYHHRVFIAPPWPEIYVHDEERTHTFDEAVRGYQALTDAYTRHGYRLVGLPKADVESRVAFILSQVAAAGIDT